MKYDSSSPRWLRTLQTGIAAVLSVVLFMTTPMTAIASSWDPTLLVNTEAFQIIDEGDGASDVYLQFGDSLDERITFDRTDLRFEFTDDVQVQGALSASGALSVEGNIVGSGSLDVEGSIATDDNIVINQDQTDADASLTFGNDAGNETLTFSNTNERFEFSDDANVTGNFTASGTIHAEGVVSTDAASIAINQDQSTGDATLTFGNDGGNETITFNDTTNDFDVSDDVNVTGDVRASGALSGDTLNVDSGTVSINNVDYTFSGTQGGSNTFLRNDGAGSLTWSTFTVGNGSGQILSFHPEYPNAMYEGDGSTNVGRLRILSGSSLGTAPFFNHYRWLTSRSTIQDYDIVTRIRVPDNFTSWDTLSGVTLQYRTNNTTSGDNNVQMFVYDTAGTLDDSSGAQTSTTFETYEANAAALGGTYTPGEYMTVVVKLSSRTSSNFADAGFLNIVWDTTTP